MSRDRFAVVVHVLLFGRAVHPNQLFLLRRAGTGFMDGFYVPPGGHQQAGESVMEAARREVREETAFDPGVLTPVCVLPYRSGRHQGTNFVFEADVGEGQPVLAEPECSDRAEWMALHALPEPLAPWLADALELRERGGWFRELDYS